MIEVPLATHLRTLEDAHERRAFVPVTAGRLPPEAGFAPALYGELDPGHSPPSTRPFALHQISGRWFINSGFLEGVQVNGTNAFITLPPTGTALWLRAEIRFAFTTFSARHIDPANTDATITLTHHIKAGPYQVLSAQLLVLPLSAAPPAPTISPFTTTNPAEIHSTDLWYTHLTDIAANGSHTPIPTWLRLSADLSQIL